VFIFCVLHVSLDGSRAVDLPFELPDGPIPVELPPDTQPMLEGHEQLGSYHIGGPDWGLPPDLAGGAVADALSGADAVTLTVHQRYDKGQLIPNVYQVTYWRKTDG
jgi:hypothetical protein